MQGTDGQTDVRRTDGGTQRQSLVDRIGGSGAAAAVIPKIDTILSASSL